MSRFLVIGAGVAGASAAWHLTGRGHEVVVLERTHPANDEGSSHGSARIMRYAYPQPLYTDLVVRARPWWSELERASGTHLLTPCGSLDHGVLREPRRLARVLQGAGVEHELLSAAAARQRWPQLTFDTEVLWHPGAAVMDCATAVRAMLQLATATGLAEVRTDWWVSSVRTSGGGYRVTSSSGEVVEGSHVVVAAGGWLPALLTDVGLPEALVRQVPPLQVRQEQAVHFPYRSVAAAAEDWTGDRAHRTSGWPTFIYKGHDLQVYGLPGGRDAGYRGQKVAQFNGGRVISSALQQDGVVDPAARKRLVDFATRALPGVVPEPYAETTCLFTTTPTEDFVIDSYESITIVSACSGHGGKFAPLVGELVADAATASASVPDAFHFAAQIPA